MTKPPNPYTSGLVFSAPGTADKVLSGQKDVTRRLRKTDSCRWKVGRLARAYAKTPRNGGKPIAELRIGSIWAERLSDILNRPQDVEREGSRAKTPEEFVALFLKLHDLPPDTDPATVEVWRIGFKLETVTKAEARAS